MGDIELRELSPVMMVFFTAFVSMGVLLLGLFVSMMIWPVGTALFAVGALGVIASPLIGFGIWWAIHEGRLLAE